jgi:N-carbamoyl-L-amino-acid hydrolase
MSFEELWQSLLPIGRDATTGGYRRFAWTSADAECRAWFISAAGDRGLTVETDRNGNLWAWWGEPGSDAVVTGSHLDSVPEGGAFDGPLGVVSAFAAIDRLRAQNFVPSRPLAVVCFADEEGARFGLACVGSRLTTGLLDIERAHLLRDSEGVTLAAALERSGIDPQSIGRDDEALSRIGAFVELHVEQGRGLVHLGAPVGVASAIWPHGRWRWSFAGEGNHAGTTRIEDRRDPMLPFATTVLAARDIALDEGALATFGKVRVEPNGTNAIPSAVQAWLDARAPDEEVVRRVLANLEAVSQSASATHSVSLDVVEESWTPVVEFGTELRDRISAALGGVPALPTGAGHDAGILAGFVPSAMLFVRNPTGVSHSPVEHAELDDCLAGVEALATVLEELAR